MSAFCGALASFYNKIPIFHIEAGLRSYNNFEPYPEEALRSMIARIVDLHFAPTQNAYNALIKENILKEKIFITGNTVVDAIKYLSNSVIKKLKNI
ncbi:UDP-N-acetylglucosamine 2-epimerase [Helicobacter winghamensis]|uniref:UDP-N-acetylglucosamine 2-epimerase n=1 Tax=Helicobacter winghamensis TaxID=157268 RepID=UPI0024317E6A|nr:UDP-N-acetylglucosamine 2-epimerase [Helicobacter winghamensis]